MALKSWKTSLQRNLVIARNIRTVVLLVLMVRIGFGIVINEVILYLEEKRKKKFELL